MSEISRRRALAACIVLCAMFMSVEAHAGWPSAPGWLYSELSFNRVQADRVAGGVDSLQITNYTARLYGELGVHPQAQAILNLPVVHYYGFGDDDAIRVGDLTLGGRYFVADNAVNDSGLALSLSFYLTVPTVLEERQIGETYVNDEGESSRANSSTGVFVFEPRAGLTFFYQNLWIDFEGGISFRTEYVDQFYGLFQLFTPWAETGASSTVGIHGRLNQDPRPEPAGGNPAVLVANGVGEYSEFIGWYVRLDYAFDNGVGIGVGYDSAFVLNEYPAGAALMGRISYSGQVF